MIEVYFKKIAYVIVKAGKSEICRKVSRMEIQVGIDTAFLSLKSSRQACRQDFYAEILKVELFFLGKL